MVLSVLYIYNGYVATAAMKANPNVNPNGNILIIHESLPMIYLTLF